MFNDCWNDILMSCMLHPLPTDSCVKALIPALRAMKKYVLIIEETEIVRCVLQ